MNLQISTKESQQWSAMEKQLKGPMLTVVTVLVVFVLVRDVGALKQHLVAAAEPLKATYYGKIPFCLFLGAYIRL